MRGSLKTIKPGLVYDLIVSTKGPDGKRKQLWRRFKGSWRQAETALAALVLEVEGGHVGTASGKQTVAAYLDGWLPKQVGRLRLSTYQGYEGAIRRYLRPAIGSLALRTLRAAHLEAAYAAMKAKGAGPRTVALVHSVLRKALNDAVRLDLLAANPALKAEVASAPRQVMDLPDIAQVTALLDALRDEDSWIRPIAAMALLTGSRRNELLAARWSDIGGGALHITRSVEAVKGGQATYGDTKTQAGCRSVPLSQEAVTILDAVRSAQDAQRTQAGIFWQATDLIFTRADGTPWQPSSITHAWTKATRKAGVKLTFHGLRHLAATYLLAGGAHVRTVSAILGHSQPSVTLNIYAHALPSLAAEAMRTLGHVVNPSRNEG